MIPISNAIKTTEDGFETITITTDEIIVDKSNVLYKTYEAEQLQLQKPSIGILSLRMLRRTSLSNAMFGYNRITVLKGKHRCIITSSYNHSVFIIDTNGNWQGRRTMHGIAQQPWGICVNSNFEIFIGDNQVRCIFVFDSNWKFLRKIAENASSGFFDMDIDNERNEIFIANLFNSQIVVVDEINGNLCRKINIPTPTYLRLGKDKLFVVNTDYIYVLNKISFEVFQTIKLEFTDYIYGLYIDENLNIYTTAYEIDVNSKRSREVTLFIIRSSDKHILKKVKTSLLQVNDIAYYNGIIYFLNDTHIDLYEYDGNLENENLEKVSLIEPGLNKAANYDD